MTPDPAQPLRTRAVFTNAHLHSAYQELWAEIWAGPGSTKFKDGEVRAIVLGLLIDGAPVKVAREIVKGLRE